MCLRLHRAVLTVTTTPLFASRPTFGSHGRCRLTALPMPMLCLRGTALPSALATQKGDGVLPCVKLCWGRGLTLQGSCLGSVVLHFGDTAFPVLFILLSRASIQHWDNWARVASNNGLCAQPRLTTLRSLSSLAKSSLLCQNFSSPKKFSPRDCTALAL